MPIRITTKEKVLYALKENKGDFISGEKLASAIDCSRTAIWKQVQELKKEGYVVNSSSRLGYQLVEVPDLILPLEIKHGLGTKFMGREAHYFDRLESTVDVAKDLAVKGASQGTIVIAEEQSKGRGRLEREWVSPKGGIWFSAILKPSFMPQDAPLITLAAACSLTQTVRDHLSLEAKIKWPNDVLISGKKVAGILTEMDAEPDRIIFVILSMGINANVDTSKFPPDLERKSTSLKKALKREVNRVSLLQALFTNFEREYKLLEEGEKNLVLAKWKKNSVTLGKNVRISMVNKKIEGKAVGLNSQGALLVQQLSGKVETVQAGDVTLA